MTEHGGMFFSISHIGTSLMCWVCTSRGRVVPERNGPRVRCEASLNFELPVIPSVTGMTIVAPHVQNEKPC